MRFPSLSRREEPAPPADDEVRAGAVATDTRTDERPDVEGNTDGSTTRRGPTGDSTTDRAERQPDARRSAEARAATARSTVLGSRRARAAAPENLDGHRATGVDHAVDGDRDRTVDDLRTTDRAGDADRGTDRERGTGTGERNGAVDADRTPGDDASRDLPPAPVGPRPRASLLATLGLIVGVAGVLFVLTGTLAGYGIALGAGGAVLAVLGLIATRRRHIAGKSDALLGIAFGIGAVVLGVLAMTGQYDWPTTDGDLVARFREWLDSQFVDRL
ncbi:hypothetical protein GCM10029963_59610 [Micromonospora andamanensis]|uniref:DMT family transporter n=1 Tax=Micromonospora andamanensis TaxID=1287068 RepID=UPI00194F090D|nr:DMT family transporter [Micromonospora andamanensis]GIJ40742.1 hypothetical protein Vwe01_40670 [Micromonospora andamanensis]